MSLPPEPSLLCDGRPFRRADASRWGLSAKRLDCLLADGRLSQPFRGVYVDSTASDDVAGRSAAATLVLPTGGVVARRSAAWLYGFDTRSPAERDIPLPLECLVPVGTTPPRHRGLVAHTGELTSRDVSRIAGVRLTSATRTAADLARYLDPHMGLALLDAMLHKGVIMHTALEEELRRFEGGRWVQRARRLVDLAEPLTESYGESWLRLRIADAGFPRPRPQMVIQDARGGFVGRADLADPRHRLVIEYDGQEHHSSTNDQEHDLRRRASMARLGWRVIVATRNEVLGRSMALEAALGDAYSMAPAIRRRAW